MAIDVTPSTVATSALQALPFSSLIGGPLNACIEAQARAAQTTWTFIQQVGLNEDPLTKQRTAINVEFEYQKDNEMAVLVIPLLTIVPIPYIAIDTIDIAFKASISASASSLHEESSQHAFGVEVGAKVSGGMSAGATVQVVTAKKSMQYEAEFKANYSSKKDSKATQESKYSVEYTMDVDVHAGQDSMPAGLATVLGILRESITTGAPNGVVAPSVTSVSLKAGSSDPKETAATIGATAMNRQNLLLKAERAPLFTFTLQGQPAGLKIAAQPVRGTVASGTTPSATEIVVQSDEDGIASVSVSCEQAFAANATLVIKAAIDGKERSAKVAIVKAA